MDNLFVVILISFVAGTLMTWIIRKLLFEKNYISKIEFQTLNEQLSNLRLENGKLEERYGLLKDADTYSQTLL